MDDNCEKRWSDLQCNGECENFVLTSDDLYEREDIGLLEFLYDRDLNENEYLDE